MSLPQVTAMTTADFVADIRQHRLLEPAQLEELQNLQARFTEPKALAKELIQRGWLTVYQVNQIGKGHAADLRVGTYLVLERLGEGGMGAVFKARHDLMGRVAALKVIRKERLTHPDAVKRFHREIQAAAQLTHPNVVHAFDADQVDGTHFFIMEYIEGIDLHRLVKQQGPLPVEQACDYIRQAAVGLQHAFEKGMVHRDIKPQNLLRDGQGTIKILDMGLARIAQAEGNDAGSSNSLTQEGSLTQDGVVMGSLDYIAPEQALDSHTVDIRADLYSLGCTFYYLLTGRVPFPGGDALQKLMKHKVATPEPVEKLRPDVPVGVVSVVRKLMAKNPADRFQIPADVAAVLAAGSQRTARPLPTDHTTVAADAVRGAFGHVGGNHTAEAVETPQRRPANRRWLLGTAAGGVALLSALGIFGFLLLNGSRSTTTTATVAPPINGANPPPSAVAPFNENQAKEYQRVWAEYLKGKVVETNRIGLKLRLIPPGKFAMGSSQKEIARCLSGAKEGWEDGCLISEGPEHEVEITQPFYLGETEVTVGQFRQFVQEKNYPVGDNRWQKPAWEQTDNHPVGWVTWDDAVAFCNWLSAKEGKKYRLPTEAEWQYSCRAGTKTRYSFGDREEDLLKYAWINTNARGTPQPVKGLAPNAWGLHDMHGNMWEWCQDWYAEDYYKKSPKRDPAGPSAGAYHVILGGACNKPPLDCRSAFRNRAATAPRDNFIGFRVLLVPASSSGVSP
jgi:formylglycine-generating enzyme required for sulfatase activity/serine/threonine protein kinase